MKHFFSEIEKTNETFVKRRCQFANKKILRKIRSCRLREKK
ncbi:hypothetical protein BSM4216_2792 [Bacillus smithii]|nr:hypothetical protein BSM4216_2792 [Bacillus smithii]